MWRRVTMSKLVVTILVFALIHSHRNDVEAKDSNGSRLLNEPAISLSPTTPKPLILQKNETHLNSTRKSRFLPTLSFLTGLGLGSIAGTVALDPSFIPAGNYSFISKLITTTKAPPTDLDLNFGSSELFPLANIPPSNIYNPNYPYILALSTNALLNKTLRSVQETLQKLNAQLKGKETVNEEQVAQSSDEVDQVEEEESNDVSVYRDKDDYVVVNRTTLKDIVKASIAEQIESGNQILLKQARPPRLPFTTVNPTTESITEDETTLTTEDTNNMITTQIPSSTWQPYNGWYYGGQSQNISGVDITSGTYGPPIQPVYPVYPPHSEVYPASPPVFEPAPFYQDHHPEYYETYPGSVGGLNGISDSYPYYDHFARGRKFSSRGSKDLGGFVPLKKI
ncbi:uncharacterized protein LOC107037558 [Diachasma alloeum]|uniref:uncharacterized protein LOC107037558 n=1 Tax=Diachasma alloeum TaxID=454923 RepID=UPI00073817A4|nr:uncharacterized protein LOC107037558 [Diachasma alloeum]